MADRKPEWLKIKLNTDTGNITEIKKMLSRLSLHTVCEEANCPNMMECFGKRTATFMIMGRICSRNCRFCNVESNLPTALDKNEPEHIAEAVKELNLKHVVITSVTRDDLPDGGAAHFAETIRAVKRETVKLLLKFLFRTLKAMKKLFPWSSKQDLIF